jgi:hypothetical protein
MNLLLSYTIQVYEVNSKDNTSNDLSTSKLYNLKNNILTMPWSWSWRVGDFCQCDGWRAASAWKHHWDRIRVGELKRFFDEDVLIRMNLTTVERELYCSLINLFRHTFLKIKTFRNVHPSIAHHASVLWFSRCFPSTTSMPVINFAGWCTSVW